MIDCRVCGKRHRTLTEEECGDRQMSERTLQDRVMDRAQRRGWKVAHAGRGAVSETAAGEQVWITPMSPGWPDLFMARGPYKGRPARVLAIELKRETNNLEPEQIEWLQLLNAAGVPAVEVKPSDLRLGRVNAILK